ncbi:MAG TPA: hypothetical protein H9950_03725 [Candidatus Bacteroides avicola]|uniref:Uncharacterized protein n=1 Tax=Candidatus Bacteroides avicola TaxID=2838468 RepID=A0A9D2KVK9_9BACE|nr:hypothetical protein [Candidatus Bacteroides avicola]
MKKKGGTAGLPEAGLWGKGTLFSAYNDRYVLAFSYICTFIWINHHSPNDLYGGKDYHS